MHALFQRLRELDWDTFQRLAFQLLSERQPGLKIRHVGGAGGDQGLDSFEGELDGESTIWQCKQFPNGLGPKQREQVKESLRTALENFKPKAWILVVSIDLDAKAHKWFQKLQRAYKDKTAVGLFQASDIVRELIHRRNIRDNFFPGAVLDTIEMRRLITDLGDASSEDLEKSSQEQLDEIIARFERADARFHYQIVYGPNVGADIAEARPADPLHVASVVDERRRVDVFARDIEALRLDPLKVQFMAKETGLAKLQELRRTGRRQELGTEDISYPTSGLDFLLPKKETTGWRVVLTSVVPKKPLLLRVTFESGADQVRYDLIQFRTLSLGAEQAEIESISPLPFVLSLSLALAPGSEGNFSFKERFEGANVRTIAKVLRAKSVFRLGGTIELHALETDALLATLNVNGTAAAITEERQLWERAILDAARICEVYRVDFELPEIVENHDLETLALLLRIADGGEVPFDSFNTDLVKSTAHEEVVYRFTEKTLRVIANLPELNPPLVVFGVAVRTGPVVMEADEAHIDSPNDFLARYKNARYGESIKMRLIVTKGVRMRLGGDGTSSLFVKPIEDP